MFALKKWIRPATDRAHNITTLLSSPIAVLVPLVALILLFLSLVPAILGTLTPTSIAEAIRLLESKGYWVSADGECYPGDLLPCTDNTQELGSADKRWGKGWFGSSSVHIGSLEISNTAQQMDIDGQLILHDAGKVWMEIQPDLDYATVRASGKPTQVYRGVSSGFSLPIYNNDNEELFVSLDVPREWDGITDPIAHIHCYIPGGGNEGNLFNLELAWDSFTPADNDRIDSTPNIAATETTCVSNIQYKSYTADFVINYDAEGAGETLTTCDQMDMRLRRTDATNKEVSGEVVINAHWCPVPARQAGRSAAH